MTMMLDTMLEQAYADARRPDIYQLHHQRRWNVRGVLVDDLELAVARNQLANQGLVTRREALERMPFV